jgi:outer membrane biosynthesis protein TonB
MMIRVLSCTTLNYLYNFTHLIMPYIIAVIALVIASVGFTLFQSSNTTAVSTTAEPVAVERGVEAPNASSTTSTDTGVTGDNTTPTKTPLPTDTPPTPTPVPTPTPTPKPVPTPTPRTTAYKNGTYSAQASYRVPAGPHQMQVTITIANDKITSANIAYDARTANDGYTMSFNDSYQSEVIGQNLGSVNPSRIGGASLTTNAFNSALGSIRNQATS